MLVIKISWCGEFHNQREEKGHTTEHELGLTFHTDKISIEGPHDYIQSSRH